jgi:hypothetical protein
MPLRCGDRLETHCVQSPEVLLLYAERESPLLVLSKAEPEFEYPKGGKRSTATSLKIRQRIGRISKYSSYPTQQI